MRISVMSRKRAGSGDGFCCFDSPSRPKLMCKRLFDFPGGLPLLALLDDC